MRDASVISLISLLSRVKTPYQKIQPITYLLHWGFNIPNEIEQLALFSYRLIPSSDPVSKTPYA